MSSQIKADTGISVKTIIFQTCDLWPPVTSPQPITNEAVAAHVNEAEKIILGWLLYISELRAIINLHTTGFKQSASTQQFLSS